MPTDYKKLLEDEPIPQELNIPSSDEDLYGDIHTEQEAVETFISFRLDTEWYAIRILKVREVIRIKQITALPSVPPHIIGLINLRGNILSVTDPKQLFGLASSSIREENWIIVIEEDNVQIGIIVDELGDLVVIPINSLEPPLATLEARKMSYIEHIYWRGKQLVAIVHVEKLFMWKVNL